MTARRYVQITYPWHATIDMSSPEPALFLGQLFQQTLRFGNPGFRRFGALRSAIARADLPPAWFVSWLVRKGSATDSELGALEIDVREAWPSLRQSSRALPELPRRLSLLELRRAAARTVFVFGDQARPLVVLKIPGDAERVDREAAALRAVAAAAIAPRFLGQISEARVQEGLSGRPLRVEGVAANAAAGAGPSEAHVSLAAALERLASTTATPGQPEELNREGIEQALDRSSLTTRTRDLARAAARSIDRVEIAVVKHGDTSAQNCLFEDDRLVGLVDWETARLRGAPGFDAWNASLALFEHGLGLRKSTEESIRTAFRSAWGHSPYFHFWRAAARDNARAGGVAEDLLDPLEICFFARRLEHRLERPTGFATGAETAAHMLETVCGY